MSQVAAQAEKKCATISTRHWYSNDFHLPRNRPNHANVNNAAPLIRAAGGTRPLGIT